MKIGFICPNLPGHLNPMTALARHLQARNHEVVFLYSTEANGLPFVPGPEKDHINENRTEQSKRHGEDALRSGVRQVLAQTETILKSLPETVRTNGVDALLLDTVQFYAELGPMQLGMPYVQVSNGLHLDYSGYTPLCVYGWPHETTPAALARNREGVGKWADLLQSVAGRLRAHAQSIGLKSTGTTSPPLFPRLHQLPKLPVLSTSKVRIGLRSFITPVHSTMTRAGRKWISPGND